MRDPGSGPADASEVVEVEIAGSTYRLRPDPEAGGGAGIEGVAGLVDRRMAQILDAVPGLATERAAILAALNLAQDFLAERARGEAAAAGVEAAVAQVRVRLRELGGGDAGALEPDGKA